jgi:Protein of unknown function (DUF4232)
MTTSKGAMMRTKVLLAAVCAAVAAITCTTATAAFAARPATSTPRCTTSELGVWIAANHANGAAGTIYYPLEFTNLSTHTCALEGYPGVSALASNGSQLGDAASRFTFVKETTVKLGADQSAYAYLAYHDAVVGSCASKDVRDAYNLRVYPPGSTSAIEVPWDWPTCIQKGNLSDFLGISVVTPIGTGGIG